MNITTLPDRISISHDCLVAFERLKTARLLKWIIFRISTENEIVVQETCAEDNLVRLREKLVVTTSRSQLGDTSVGRRMVIYHTSYALLGPKPNILLLHWSPRPVEEWVNRLYTAATDELLNALHCDGSVLLQDPEEIDEAEIARRFAQRKVI